MPATLAFFGRVQRKILQCGVPIDPDSCRCPTVETTLPQSAEKVSVGIGEYDDTSAGSGESLNKLTTDNIKISIYLDRVFSIFCRTLKKLELSASLQMLLIHPEVPHILNEPDFKLITDAFHQYVHIEPCTWQLPDGMPFISACSESQEALKSAGESSQSICSSTNLGNFNPKICQAIQILNSYKEIRKMVKQFGPEYSEQAQLFLGYVKYFIEHSLKRMRMTPEECRAKDLHYRGLWRDNEKAKMDLRTLTAALDEQRKQHDNKMEVINAQCERDLATIKRVNKKCKEDIKYTVIKSEREMMMMYKASEIKQKEIREDVINAESHLKTIRASNLALEKAARDKRFKIESQLLGVINKYDTEIGEQQKQMEYLIAEFEADKKKKQDLEAEIENQAVMYDALMKERQEASEAIINEKLAKLILIRVVKIIQRWWRGIREKRKANIVKIKKKKTKNKNFPSVASCSGSSSNGRLLGKLLGKTLR